MEHPVQQGPDDHSSLGTGLRINPEVWLCRLETVLAQHLDSGDPAWPEPQGSVPSRDPVWSVYHMQSEAQRERH